MINSILIGKYIYKFLSENQALKDKVNGKISPLITYNNSMNNNGISGYTQFPFIIYRRQSINTEYCKDCAYQDTVMVDVLTASNDYTEAIEIANLVRETLEGKGFVDQNIRIMDMRLRNVEEDYLNDAFVQNLTFDIKVGQV